MFRLRTGPLWRRFYNVAMSDRIELALDAGSLHLFPLLEAGSIDDQPS
jgi:hypothetical protein